MYGPKTKAPKKKSKKDIVKSTPKKKKKPVARPAKPAKRKPSLKPRPGMSGYEKDERGRIIKKGARKK